MSNFIFNDLVSIVISYVDRQDKGIDYLDRVNSFCLGYFRDFEIILVHNESFVPTSDFPRITSVKLRHYRGEGHAIKQGVLKAQGDVIIVLNPDSPIPVQEISSGLQYLAQGFDIALGSWTSESSRYLMGDVRCGFKMFRRKVIRPLFSRIYLRNRNYILELLFLAGQMGYLFKKIRIKAGVPKISILTVLKDAWTWVINGIEIRIWHCTPVFTEHKFMTTTELQSMYLLEKEHWWFVSKGRFIRGLIAQFFHRQVRILDAGCGTGGNHAVLAPFGNYTGCDVIMQGLQLCAKNNVPRLVQCQVEDLAFCDQSFDLVTSLDVIEHAEDPDKALREYYRVLSNDGLVVITVPAFRFLWGRQDDALCHQRRYTRRDLAIQLEDAGFQVLRSGYFFCATFFLVVLVRKCQTLFPRQGAPVSDTGYLPPAWINSVLKFVYSLENQWAWHYPLPWGTSVYAVARKI